MCAWVLPCSCSCAYETSIHQFSRSTCFAAVMQYESRSVKDTAKHLYSSWCCSQVLKNLESSVRKCKYHKSLKRQERQPHVIANQNVFDYSWYHGHLAQVSVLNFGNPASHHKK